MAESPTFVTEEKLSSSSQSLGVVRLNLRLFGDLPLFLRFVPISVVFILLASLSPSFFRWYAGKLASGETSFHVPWLERDLPFSAGWALALVAFATFCRVTAWAVFELSGMWATLDVHARMVRAVGRSRTTFFDENPSGRLLNRLIRDYDEVRGTGVIFVGDFLNAMVEVLSVGLITAFANPWASVLLIPLLTIFFYIQTQRSAMIEHARGFAAIATSRVIGRKHDLIEGREVYLLYGKVDRLLERMRGSFDEYIRASALTNQVETWASFWMRTSAEAFAFLILLFVVHALSTHWIDSALGGVIISALIGITGSIGWLDFATSYISKAAPHIRRVYDYVDLPAENTEEGTPRPSAPTEGAPKIEFRNYTMSYRADTPQILRGLSLVLRAGEKTALIGRTGSGKTSVFQALLRMVHVADGDIRIDGHSIFGEELRSLRRRFGVVPQFPYLFTGTIRSNLDRTGEIPEATLFAGLESVGLKGISLDSPVVEGGQNLSLGERQLVCLARVIAAGKEIILMDEPTSGLDPETDARVSRILREALAGKTVVTVAHRLETVQDYDRVVEMSNGAVVWEGLPSAHPSFRRES